MSTRVRAWAVVFCIVHVSAVTQAVFGANTKSNSSRKARQGTRAPQRLVGSVSSTSRCGQCAKSSRTRSTKGAVSRKPTALTTPCHPPGFVDPAVAPKLSAAFRDMKRLGIEPRITSAWRSSQKQAKMHLCSLNRRCKRASGLYGALPAGQSAHEAGFAVDITGVASRTPRGRRLTPAGREIVRIMTKHGFTWRYGLSDPVHFEANPRRHGYRTLQQAIVRNQTRCQLRRPRSAQLRARKGSGKASKRVPALRTIASGKTNPRNRS
jgi:hypothetical protein